MPFPYLIAVAHWADIDAVAADCVFVGLAEGEEPCELELMLAPAFARALVVVAASSAEAVAAARRHLDEAGLHALAVSAIAARYDIGRPTLPDGSACELGVVQSLETVVVLPRIDAQTLVEAELRLREICAEQPA
jgi:hypothetical protein